MLNMNTANSAPILFWGDLLDSGDVLSVVTIVSLSLISLWNLFFGNWNLNIAFWNLKLVI